ncbi:myb-like protein X [Cydia strobilella]|uniref:myb-like protein X n=1 Tax=Cydia strobilella TaxID=1100964 RepID=UPI0030051F7A
MEEDDSDSDCTVLLIDFVNEPQKVDAKRRRLSHLQDRSKQAGHDENTARNDVSQNIQTDLPKNNIEKNWLITKYLSGINKANIRNNTSHENAPKYALVSKTYAGNTENTAKFNDIVICLDSDDETESNEKSQNQDTNKGLTEISSANDLLHETKLIVLKPAAINAQRPTTNIFESNQMFSNEHVSQRPKGNEPARLKVLKRSIITEQKATTHFEENNLKRNSSNGKENISKNDKMESGNNKLADIDSYRFIPPRLSPLESNIPNTTSSTSSGTNAGIRVASQAENSLTSILTVSNNKLYTNISDSTIIDNKDFQQDTENKTVANIKAKRYGNNETQIEPKRIKMNLKPKCSVKQHADTEQMINEKCKANVMREEISNEEIGQELREQETCDRDKQNRSKMQENRDETVQSEANIEPVTFKDNDSANEELNAEGAIKILNKTTLSTTNEAQESKQVQNELEIIKVQNGQIKSKACDKQVTNNLSSKNQKTSQVVNETAPTEANTEPETFEDQDSANEVLNTEGAIKLLDKTTLSTTSEAQESKQVQNELEIIKVQNRQINSEACDKHETNKLYEEQRTIETLNREDKEEETRQVSGEQTTNESHTKQGTDQLNKTPREEEKQNDDSEDPVADNVDNSNTNCGNVDGASETITTENISNQTTTNSRKIRKPSTSRDMSCNKDEERCDSDETSSKSSDEDDDDKRDENKTKTLHTSGEEDNNSSSSTDRVTNVEQVNSTRDGKLRKRCKANKGENASDSDWSPVSNSDCFNESSTRERKAHKNKRCTGNTETVSEDEIIKASDYLTRRRKKRTTKLFGAERQGLRATTLQKTAASEESDSDWIVSDENSHESADSFDEMKYCDSQNTGIDESTDNEMEEDYDSQKTDVRDSNDDSNLTTDEEYLPVSNNKTLITSMRTSKKRKQSFLKFVNDSIDTDETDGDQQVASEESDNELLTGPDNQCDNNEIASESFGEERLSEDEIIKVSENTRKKRKERMSTLFDDDIEISLQNNDGNAQEQTNNSTNHIISVVDKSGNKDVEINKSHAERPDLRKGENGLENFINVADHQVQNKEVYCKTNDRDLATESSNTTVVSEQNNTSKLSNVILRDDDRLEIDLIDCLLKEYNTRDEQRNDSYLEIHMSLHHSATKYEFRVQQITFQEERDYDSSEPLESTTDNNVEDLNIKNEMLKDETLSQGDININQEDSEILSSLEGRVQQMSINADSDINIEVKKNELLSQNTNDNIDTIEGNINMNSIADNSAQIMFTADDVNFKGDFKKRDSKKTLDIYKEDFANKITVVNATQIESNVEDLNIKQEMLKNEVSSQNTIEEDIQEYTKAFEEHLESVASVQLLVIDEDLNNKKEMLKDESFSQNTNEKNSQQSQDVIEENLMKKTATTIDDAAQINSNVEDLITKTDVLKDKTLSENTIEESTEEKTEISEKAEQNRSSTNILLVIQGHNIKGDMLKNELTRQNTNIDIQNRLHMEDFVNNIENPTQEIFSNVALNVHSLKSGVNNEEKNLENKNAVVDLETENSKVVESEDAIVIEDSDDGDVELIGVVNRVFNIRQFFRSGY